MLLQSVPSPRAAAPVEPVAQPAPTATPTAAATAKAPAAQAAAAQAAPAQPVEDASFAAKLLGKVGTSQNRFLANQQLLGEVTSVLGARLSQSFSNVLRLLKGEAPAEEAGVTG